MRSYCSLYVDAGYLQAAASTRVTGTSLRGATEMDVAGLLAAITRQVERDCGMPLLRIHWYDAGTRAGSPVGDQRDIAMLPKVKLRLGRIGFNGEQKGVDLKLALDLIAQSRNRVAEVVYLISGDDDLSEAVEEAQQLGVQVVALAVPGEEGLPLAFSRHLQQTVDRMMLIDADVIDAHVRRPLHEPMHESVAEPVAEPAAAALAEVAESPPAAERPVASLPAPARPTPLSIAQHRPPPIRTVPMERPAPRAVPAYVTTTGAGGHFPGASAEDTATAAAIAAVVDSVVHNWWRSSTASTRAELLRDRPVVPPDIDRTLLNDLSNRLGTYELPTHARFALRAAFWEKIEQLG